jgi:hypothetical protein
MTKRSRGAVLCGLMLVLVRDAYAQEPFPTPFPAPAPVAVPAVPAPPAPVAVPATPAPPAPVAAPRFAQPTPQPPQAPQAPPVQRTRQTPRTQPTPQTPQTPPRGAAPATPAPAPPVVTVEATNGQLLNIQVDVTIVAEAAGEAPVRKTVSLTVADRQSGSVRSTDRHDGIGDLLNVDVMPTMQKDGRILTRVGLEYSSGKQPPVVQLRAQPLLESGKGLRVSRAVSPSADRSVTVEITATVLK